MARDFEDKRVVPDISPIGLKVSIITTLQNYQRLMKQVVLDLPVAKDFLETDLLKVNKILNELGEKE